MTERDKHIEMAQRLGLVGMRPHLGGIYIDVIAAFAKIVADDARATPALPQVDLYATPDTHRLVPVELLKSSAQETVNPFIRAKLQAIIEDKP